MLHIFIVLKLPTYENNEILLKKVYCTLIIEGILLFSFFQIHFWNSKNTQEFLCCFFIFENRIEKIVKNTF